MVVSDTLSETTIVHSRGGIRRFRRALRAVLAVDLYRYDGRVDARTLLNRCIFTPNYKNPARMRVCGWLRTKPAMAFGLHPLSELLLRSQYKFGFAILPCMLIGPACSPTGSAAST